jgi:hypothetical protein
MLDASTAVDWGGRARVDEPEQSRADRAKARRFEAGVGR